MGAEEGRDVFDCVRESCEGGQTLERRRVVDGGITQHARPVVSLFQLEGLSETFAFSGKYLPDWKVFSRV